MIENLLLIVHLVMAVALVALVLLQQGKGAQAGAAFGGGSGGGSQSLFGASGSANFMTRTTAIVATIFFITTLTLAYLYATRSSGSSVIPQTSIVEGVGTAVEQAPESDVPMVPTDETAPDAEPEAAADGVPQVEAPAEMPMVPADETAPVSEPAEPAVEAPQLDAPAPAVPE